MREKVSCRCCEAISQPPAPSHPIARGRAGPNLLALVLAAKYGQHLPLTRQSAIYAREGVELDVSTLADWVGVVGRQPDAAGAGRSGPTSSRPSACTATTPRCRCWPRSGRRSGACGAMSGTTGRSAGPIRRRSRSSTRPTAAASIPSGTWPGSPASCRRTPMPGSTGSTSPSREPGPILEAACWAHARRKLFELAAVSKAPIAAEAVRRIDELFAIEREINGKPAEERLAVRRGAGEAAGGRARGLAARPARAGLAQVGDRQGDRLRPQPLAGAHPVPGGWADLHEQQRGRAGAARHRRRSAQLDLRRLGPRWRAGGGDLHPDRDRQAQRRRPASLARRRPRPAARPPGQADRRPPAVELARRHGRSAAAAA